PQLDHVLLADDHHLAPPLFVVSRTRVGHGEVVVGCDHAAHLVQRIDPGLAREHLVLDGVAADALVVRPGRHTARPQDSSASRPPCVIRLAVHGGSHTTLTRTSMTPGSRSSRSRTSSRMNSDAGQPMAVNVRSTVTTPASSVMP